MLFIKIKNCFLFKSKMKRNNRNIEVNIEGENIVIGDLEEMKLTSKTFSIKPKNLKKIDNLALLFIFLLLLIKVFL